MANRYWVGGGGNWNDTAHWAASSGGAGGQSVPTLADNAFFDANSGSGTVNLTGVSNVKDIDFTGFTGTFNSNFHTFVVFGDITLASTMTFGFTTFRLDGSGTTQNIDGNGSVSTNVGFNIRKDGGSVVLQADLVADFIELDLNSGDGNVTVDFNDFDYQGRFSSAEMDALTTADVLFRSGTMDFSAQNQNSIFSPNITIDAGTSNILAAYLEVYGTHTLYDLTVLSFLGIEGALTVSNDLTLNNGTPFPISVFGLNNTVGALNANGSLDLSNVVFKNIDAGGTAAPFTGSALADLGGNSDIIFTMPVTRYWVGNGGDYDDTAHWSASSGGAGGATRPLAHDTVIFDENSFTLGGQTINAGGNSILGKNVSFAGVTNGPTLDFGSNFSLSVYGDLRLNAGMSVVMDGSAQFALEGEGAQVFDPQGVSTPALTVFIDANAGSYTLLSDLICKEIFLFSGTFNDGGKNIEYHDTFQAGFGGDPAKTIIATGTWHFVEGFDSFFMYLEGDITVDMDDLTVILDRGGEFLELFDLPTPYIGRVVVAVDDVTLMHFSDSGALRIGVLQADPGRIITFRSNDTFEIGQLDVAGEEGNLTTIQSSDLESPYFISKLGGSGILAMDYVNLSDAVAVTGEGGYEPVEAIAHDWSTLTGGAIPVALGDDEGSEAIAIPFDFEFFGQPKAEFYIASNGYISFNNDDLDDFSSDSIPSSNNPHDYIAGVWSDLGPDGTGIRYEVLGSAPNRVLVVEFDNVIRFSDLDDTVSFQIKLFEGSNNIEIHTQSVVNTEDWPATQGIEDATGTTGEAVSGRNDEPFSVSVPDAYRFAPAAPPENPPTYYAGLNSVDNGGNVNWIFDNPPTSVSKIAGVAQGDIAVIAGVGIASVKKVAGVSNV